MNGSILAKLEQLSMRLEEINVLLSDQAVASDQNKFRELSIEHAQLNPIEELYTQYLSTQNDIFSAEKMLKENEQDLREMAEEEIVLGRKNLEKLELEIKKSLLPKDPNDSRDIIIEIRAGSSKFLLPEIGNGRTLVGGTSQFGKTLPDLAGMGGKGVQTGY